MIPERPSLLARVRRRVATVGALLAHVGRAYPYFVVPFALVLLGAVILLALTSGASYLAPFFYAIF